MLSPVRLRGRFRMSTKGISVPVGCVLPYAGRLNNSQLMNIGWSICNGVSLPKRQYEELFGALGTSNGAKGDTFNLPDYGGFFLRGVDPTGSVDKDAKDRKPAAEGGADGPRPGSVEAYATARARTPFTTAGLAHIPTDNHYAYNGINADMLLDGGQRTFVSNAGGDKETRPINAYVQFIIKLYAGYALPTGIVVPYAGEERGGSPNLLRFAFCDGAVHKNGGEWEELFKAIGTAHGGAADQFNLPDYRGRFLRGVTDSTSRDPDFDLREQMAEGGSKGARVGSIQGWATAKPNKPFEFAVRLWNTHKISTHAAGHTNSMWNADTATVSFTNGGGDKESRPVNINVDYYILKEIDPDDRDIFPVGAVIGLPGEGLLPESQWLLCNGASRPAAEDKELFAAIQYTNGGDPKTGTFKLPNYQGCFLRGTDRAQQRDPDASQRTRAADGGRDGDHVGSRQDWATGKPKTPITGPVDHIPKTDASNAAALPNDLVANWVDASQSPTISGGGDTETRPRNANIFFYIKRATA